MPAEDAPGDPVLIDAVTDHVDRHLAETEWVLDEDVSPVVHVDLIPVPPTRERDFQVVVTCGMAVEPMHPPPGEGDGRPYFTELCVLLPPDWPLDAEAIRDERVWWPLRLLKALARYPHLNETVLWAGHTVADDEPFPASSGFAGCILSAPFPLPDAFWSMPHPRHPDEEIAFHLVVPIHAAELELARAEGASALWERFEAADVNPVIDPERPSAV